MKVVNAQQIDAELAKRLQERLNLVLSQEVANNSFLRRLAFSLSFVYPAAPWWTAIHPRLRLRWAYQTLNAAMKEAGL